MSLEIRSIGQVISYQSTPRSEFVVGMGVVKSKVNEDETITFNILQFIPVDVEVPWHVTPLSPNDVVYLHGSVTHVDSSAQTINITCYHTKKTSSLPHDFTYVTAVRTITDKPIITDTTASFDVSLSQYVKTNTGSTYQPFTVTAFHSTKNKHLLNRTAIYNSGSRIKIEGAVELYNEHIYCELQNSSFVIPKNSTPSNDNITTVSPSPSRRATIVRSIAGNSLPTKKARSIDASIPLQNTTSSGTDSSNYVQNEDTNLGDQVSNDTQAATIEPNKKPKSNKNTSRSRRVTSYS